MDVATSALDVTRIHRGDVVTCPQCGKSGEVDCDDGEAFISWSEPEACPRCGTKSARPNGEHYCHSKEQSGMTNNNLTDERITELLEMIPPKNEPCGALADVRIGLIELQYSRRKIAELDAVVDQRNGECVRLHKELERCRKSAGEPVGAPDAWLWKKSTGYLTAGISRPVYEPQHSAAIPLYACPPAPQA